MAEKRDYEYVKKYIESFHYTLLSKEYINGKATLLIECSNGHVYESFWNNFQQGKRCPICAKINRANKRRLDFEDVKMYINSFGYELLDEEYKNAHTKLNIKCDKGHIYRATFGKFKGGRRCPICNNPTHDYKYIKDCIEKVGYELLSEEYLNSYTKIKIMCDEGHVYKTTWNVFRQGSRCPICNKESKGENKVADLLSKYNIEYERQYKYEDCAFYKLLPFDFYIPKYNTLIEYDGEEHYKIIKFWGGFDKFIDRKIRDTVKNEYCKNNNIKLIRIPYWDFDNIEDILIKELNINKKII